MGADVVGSLPCREQFGGEAGWAYALNPGLPYYIGGYFWWCGAEDALRPGAPLRTALRAAFRREAAALG